MSDSSKSELSVQLVAAKLGAIFGPMLVLGLALHLTGESINLIALKLLAVPLLVQATRGLGRVGFFPVRSAMSALQIVHTLHRITLYSLFLTILLWSPDATLAKTLINYAIIFLILVAAKAIMLATEHKLYRAKRETEQGL